MLQNGLDDLPILDGADDPHGSPAFRANQWIDLIDLLNQPGPAFSKCSSQPLGTQRVDM